MSYVTQNLQQEKYFIANKKFFLLSKMVVLKPSGRHNGVWCHVASCDNLNAKFATKLIFLNYRK